MATPFQRYFERFTIYPRGKGPREVPIETVIKATALIVIAPFMLLTMFVVYGLLDFNTAIMGGSFILVCAIFFVIPYIANLSSLTYYVRELAKGETLEPPDLTFLNNVEQLQEAVNELNYSWELKRQHLERIILENKILIDSLPDSLILLSDRKDIIRINRTAQSAFPSTVFIEEMLKDAPFPFTIKRVLANGEAENFEFTLNMPKPVHYAVNIERFPIASKGGIALFVAMHDITKQKQTQQTLTDFVANASHEIRTPLTSIMGFIETMLNGAKNDPEAISEFLPIMMQQSERMKILVSDLLSLSQIEVNISGLPSEFVAIRQIVMAGLNQHRENADIRHVKLIDMIEEELPEIYGDASELMQVMDNLISNAIKYGHDNSSVTISAQLKDCEELPKEYHQRADHYIHISVSDQGDGIPAQHIPRLTERFYRVASKTEGTGLGLAIVKHIVQRHQGFLHIESTIGKGSRFSVFLPVPKT